MGKHSLANKNKIKMEVKEFKEMDIKDKVTCVNQVKNDVIGSTKQKQKYWNDGLIETLLSNMDELEMSPDLLIGAYSIFVCYTHNFEEAYDTFKYQDQFADKIIDNLTKAIELNEDNRVIDLWMQILRNLLVNEMISTEKMVQLGLLKILEKVVDNNKRINLVAQIISKMSKSSEEVKLYLLDQKSILESLIRCIEMKGSNSFRISILDCLISLSSNNESVTTLVRDTINIQKLISLIKYQNNDINAKVAYLATILNSEKKISGDFENLVKQIIFQITRMLQSPDSEDICEATTMLLNLVKSSDDDLETTGTKKSLCVHTWEIGAAEILSKILGKYSEDYLEFIRNRKKAPEDVPMEPSDTNRDEESKIIDGSLIKLKDKEAGVEDVTGNFKKSKLILNNILKIIRNLMNSSQTCTKKIINVNLPQTLFKLIDKTVGDEVRINTWECLRILARAKKQLKIQLIEAVQDTNSTPAEGQFR